MKFLDLSTYKDNVASVDKIDAYGFIWRHGNSIILLDELLCKFENLFGDLLWSRNGVVLKDTFKETLYIQFKDKEKLRLLLTKYKVLKGID